MNGKEAGFDVIVRRRSLEDARLEFADMYRAREVPSESGHSGYYEVTIPAEATARAGVLEVEWLRRR